MSTSCKDVYHTLIKYSALKSYFLSEEFADQRFSRMQDALSNTLTEVALPFLLSSIPLFNNFNKLLQSEKPIIHILHNSIKAKVIDGGSGWRGVVSLQSGCLVEA